MNIRLHFSNWYWAKFLKPQIHYFQSRLKAKNVDAARTSDNIIYKSEKLQEKYHEIFDKALEEYNLKKRSNEKIRDYYN